MFYMVGMSCESFRVWWSKSTVGDTVLICYSFIFCLESLEPQWARMRCFLHVPGWEAKKSSACLRGKPKRLPAAESEPGMILPQWANGILLNCSSAEVATLRWRSVATLIWSDVRFRIFIYFRGFSQIFHDFPFITIHPLIIHRSDQSRQRSQNVAEIRAKSLIGWLNHQGTSIGKRWKRNQGTCQGRINLTHLTRHQQIQKKSG